MFGKTERQYELGERHKNVQKCRYRRTYQQSREQTESSKKEK